MSRILFINSVCNGSTGTICKNLYKAAEEAGHTCCIAYGRGDAPEGFNTIKIGNQLDIYLHVLKSRLIDASGFGSEKATKDLIKQIEEFKPDVIHLHNIHGYYVNIEILFNYLKHHPEIKKIWTLHDCWSYTGHCAYYSYAKCDKWQTCCNGNCPNKKEYPQTIFSNVKSNFNKKREIFSGVENMILVTPSKWLKKEVEKSYLKDYPIEVINNGVDTNVFKPTPSNIKQQYGIEDKKVILGVASVWDKRKGLDTFIELSKELDNQYQIVLIGLNKKQIAQLPTNIVGISRTENVQELVKWYSAADVYFNPTLEDNYPTTNLESIACGTPVITFNTGGSPESAYVDEDKIVTNDIHSIIEAIKRCSLDKVIDVGSKKMINRYMEEYG
ncbi:glycosyltransferase [Catenibacterium sp. AM22-15]|uniref:glycosyltransferase n=1 Tax=unclassified Catenibacterium TaxID=2643636 RepID=UPI000E3F6F8E|nr:MULTISPECIES: glycosyltransferase [unclassified Catenibacterium]RGE98294.1 glycosyltransferase [Catenibacterium sp. AM22-6LB]RGF07538.1 glycosyltransferase [Catenibacterium sp. AM22-15]